MTTINKPSFLHILRSVLAALLGVQKSDHANQDFAKGNPWVYVAVGVACLVLFVITLMIIVSIVVNP